MFDELRAIQQQFGYLPSDQLHKVAKKLQIPVSQIHAVVSFYPHFRLTSPPQLDVRVCADMSCHLRGAPQLQKQLKDLFEARGADEIDIRDVSCLGRCDTAPAVSINDVIYSGLSTERIVNILQAPAMVAVPRPHNERPQKLAMDPYGGTGQYLGVRRLVESRDFASVIGTLKDGGLRGLGGAGFPTGAKWEIVRNAPGKQKYVVCNADESEPGTIKDRFLMERLPYLLIEGMILAGLVTGARKGYIYIRHEYEEPKAAIDEELARCYRDHLLGNNILGSDLTFDLETFVSPGGYICGEETALLEALEGKRAEPRNKPPFPGTNGLWNMPTVINNVETLVHAAAIVVHGAAWYKAQGINGTSGLKFVGISGDVVRPGVFEVPMGTSYRDLIFSYAGGVPGGKKLLAFAPSGPSSGYLPADMLDLPLDFNALAAVGSMVGSGAIVVCSEDHCMLDMALNAVRFYRNESCGKCVPCRVGSQKLVTMLSAWTRGESSTADMGLMDELFKAMRLSSICGLGQIVHAPITSVIKHFPEAIHDHLNQKRCAAGVCFQPQR